MKVPKIPLIEIRSKMDPSEDKNLADWRVREPTVSELLYFVQQARKELLEMAEMKSVLNETLKINKRLNDEVRSLSEKVRKLNALQNEDATIEMKIRAAQALAPVTRKRTIRVRSDE